MGIGGGVGVSHACAVRGRPRTVIHAGHFFSSSSSKPALVPGGRFFLGLLVSFAGPLRLKGSEGMPSFFMASLVPRLENMMGEVGCDKAELAVTGEIEERR